MTKNQRVIQPTRDRSVRLSRLHGQRSQGRRTLLFQEQLEARIVLAASGFAGNACAPNLDLSALTTQSIRGGEELVIDLFAAGATVVDLDANGNATGDVIRLQLDPDDGPANATLTSDGIFRWKPTTDQLGSFEFVIIAVDEGAPPLADAEVLVVEVRGNEGPNLAAIPDTVATVDELLEVSLSATDPDGNNLTFLLDPDQATEGVTLEQIDNTNAIVRWTPSAAFAGQSVSFSVLVVDDGFPPLSDNEVFVVNVAPLSAAVNDIFTAVAGQSLVVNAANGVLANDIEPNGEPLSVSVVEDATNGVLELFDDGSFTYTPNAEFQGTDTFTYRAVTGAGESSVATVSIRVSSTPIGNADSYSVEDDRVLVINESTGILVNDRDADGDTLMAILVEGPSGGTLNLNASGSFTFTPTMGEIGDVTFTYVASDGTTESSVTTVTISVTKANAAPVAEPDVHEVTVGETLTVDAVSGVLVNDFDDEDDPLTVVVVDPPSNGTVTLNPDGSFDYTPAADFQGTDLFTYTASDGVRASEPAAVTIVVKPIVDIPDVVNRAPVGSADSYSATEDVPLVVNATIGVLRNDTDPDDDSLTAVLIGEPGQGTLVLNPDGSFEYTPTAQNHTGIDGFSYRATDGTLSSNEILVTFAVTPTNDAPTAAVESYETEQDMLLNVAAEDGVLANDTDVEEDALTAILVDQAMNGTVELRPDGSFSYLPNAEFSGDDTFTYEASDGTDTSGATLVTVRVTAMESNLFRVSASAAAGTVVGSVEASMSLNSPVVYQVADNAIDERLLLSADDHLSGDASAPVVLIEYLDFQCPVCASYHPIITQLEQDFAGELLVVRRHLPLDGIHINARAAARAAEAAGQQGMFEEMGNLLFMNRADWELSDEAETIFEGFANDLGLDINQFRTDVEDTETEIRINRDFSAAVQLGATGTPTFFLNNTPLPNPSDAQEFMEAIQQQVDANNEAFRLNRRTGEITLADPASIVGNTTVNIPVLIKDSRNQQETVTAAVHVAADAEGEPTDLAITDLLGDDLS